MTSPALTAVLRCLVLLGCVVVLGCRNDDGGSSSQTSDVGESTQLGNRPDGTEAGVAICEALDIDAIESIAGVDLRVLADDSTNEVNGSRTCLFERAATEHPDGTSYFFVYTPGTGTLPRYEGTHEILGQPAIVEHATQQVVVDLGDADLVHVRRGVRSAGDDAWHPDRPLTEDELRRLGELAVEAHRAAA